MELFDMLEKSDDNIRNESNLRSGMQMREDSRYKSNLPHNKLEPGKNVPKVLSCKFLFDYLPFIDLQIIQSELSKKYPEIVIETGRNIWIYTIHDAFRNGETAQFCIMTTDDLHVHPIAPRAFQQSWHWTDAKYYVDKCRFEILVTEKITGLNYHQRTVLFLDFMAACIIATHPMAIYYDNAEKILDPSELGLNNISSIADLLHPISNIRIFKTPESPSGTVLMDSVGLHALGLPDLEILFSNIDRGKMAEFLIKYSCLIFERGDCIKDNEYLEGFEPGKKFRCEHRHAIAPGDRTVLHISVE
jgi:Domain of unknown function (DUF4261)